VARSLVNSPKVHWEQDPESASRPSTKSRERCRYGTTGLDLLPYTEPAFNHSQVCRAAVIRKTFNKYLAVLLF
jgi:hypothetical protein